VKKTLMTLLLGFGLVAGLSTAARADWHMDWNGYWTNHHDDAVVIQEHPEYLQDQVWLGRHHDLQVWLDAHPQYVQEYEADPYPIVVTHHTHRQHWHRFPDGHWDWY
jgi:hypothetical protein